jgi:translocation protein SEC62
MPAPVKEKKGKKGKEGDKMTPKDPITKNHKAVAKWLRQNVPTKKTKFMHSHVVEYFAGSKAIDALLEDSPFAKKNVKDPENQLYFEYREHCIEFMDELLKHKMFHRAKKIPVDNALLKPKKKKKAAETEETDDGGTKSDSAAKASKDKKKRKIRLDMHLEQFFLDTNDAYVWIYDPTPWYYWVGGSAIVLVTIAVCLFPLWPPWMRLGVHYLSIGAAGFLVFIIALGLLKYVVFASLFALSAGKLKLWIFPNLTEDVGFFESFCPAYDYTYTGGSKKKKDKDSDDEESDDEEEEEEDNDKEMEKSGDADQSQSESDDSTSKKSSTGKDFEIVDKSDSNS